MALDSSRSATIPDASRLRPLSGTTTDQSKAFLRLPGAPCAYSGQEIRTASEPRAPAGTGRPPRAAGRRRDRGWTAAVLRVGCRPGPRRRQAPARRRPEQARRSMTSAGGSPRSRGFGPVNDRRGFHDQNSRGGRRFSRRWSADSRCWCRANTHPTSSGFLFLSDLDARPIWCTRSVRLPFRIRTDARVTSPTVPPRSSSRPADLAKPSF
jgi:glycosidase